MPLDGGITNRNFRARFGDAEYVIRIPGKDTSLLEIDRGAELIANERAAGSGSRRRSRRCSTIRQCIVTEFVEGEGMSAEQLREPAVLAEVARSLRAFHASSSRCPELRLLSDRRDLRRDRRGSRRDAARRLRRGARAVRARSRRLSTGPEHEPVPCHNDLLAANFIAAAAGGRLWIVDWEYAGMGDRYFDLANFAVNNELGEAAEEALIADYFGEPLIGAGWRPCG